MKVTVYRFKVYDPVNDSWIVPSRKSPAERIEKIRGIVIPGTAEDVERSQLDSEGRFEVREPLEEHPRVLN